MTAEAVAAETGRDFIRDIVQADLDAKRYKRIVTRFPPEPNGYLHIGHAKSIALNFGIAQEFGGKCHLRFDDTNPTKEEQEYIDSIQADVHWPGYDWGTDLYYASDYFDRLYDWAEGLIKAGHAYVDDQSQEEIRLSRGTLTEPGKNSPFRDRSVEENLDLFRRMKAGEFPNGTRVLRAKIDMAAGNINLRDPVLYRILHAEHPRTGAKWSIYPSYDYAHGQSDAIEGITHSICTLEFEDHRPLYEWLLDKLPVPSKPRQYEFARLNLTYTLLSKRVLTQLVRDGHVSGWDDPRMPTIAGLKRRGVPPAAVREVVELRCTYDPATKGGNAPDGRKVKATMHWLSAAQSVPAEIRVYNQLFANPSPNAANFATDLNPESLEILRDARIEPSVAADNSGEVMQFERQGYFVRDKDSMPGKPVFNRTIGLRDTFAKEVGGKG